MTQMNDFSTNLAPLGRSGLAPFYESSMDCILVSGKLFSNTAALDSL